MKRGVLVALTALSLTVAQAELFKFYSITDNDPSGYAQFVGESQLLMHSSYLESGYYSLVFENIGPNQSVISEIYFDYNPELRLRLVAINNGEGVDFSTGKTRPANLPAGQSIPSSFNSDLAVSARNPSPQLGINASEYLELIVDYDGSGNLLTALGNEELRVGLHVISLGEYSESFVNVVPEPATFTLALSGSLFMRLFRIKKAARRKKKTDVFEENFTETDRNELCWVEKVSKKDRRTMPLTSCEAAVWKTVS